MKITAHIQNLLYRHDCVVVPGFGGFVANYFPSQIDGEFGIITPPSKQISFNKNLLNNDGLLAQHIVEVERLSYTEANSLIADWVSEVKITLNAVKRFEFEFIGVFFKGAENEVSFVPDGSQNYFSASYGLKRVFARPLLIEDKIEIKEAIIIKPIFTVEKETPVELVEPETKVVAIHQKKSKWWVAAATIPLLCFIGYASIQNDFRNPGQWQMANLNPFDANCHGSYRHIDKDNSTIKTENGSYLEEILNEATDDKAAWVTYNFSKGELHGDGINIIVTPLDNTIVAIDEPLNYFVVAGCFSNERNANKLVRDLNKNGYSGFVYDHHNGLYRVVVQGFARKNEAKSFLKEIRSKVNKGAWLLKK